MEHENIKPGQIMYWARILPKIQTYDLYELKVRTLYDTYFVAVDKRSKQSYIFPYKGINKTIFTENLCGKPTPLGVGWMAHFKMMGMYP